MNIETIKSEVYKNEKNKLIRRILIFNSLFLIFLSIFLSANPIHPNETEIIESVKYELNHIYDDNIKLKNIITDDIESLKIIDDDIYKKLKTLISDTVYFDINRFGKIIDERKISYNKMELNINSILDSIYNLPTLTPISSSDMIRISSKFGYRKHPISKKWTFHEGIDISATKKTEVYSTSDGIIENIYLSNTGYGNRVIINHKNGYKTVYAHLNSITVKKGQIVKRNDKIGYVGNTGSSTNNHLHYEILLNNRPVDPLNYIYSYNKNH
ncbi:MAG: M23 family metallopeptidase [Saccharofermentanales bacterium]